MQDYSGLITALNPNIDISLGTDYVFGQSQGSADLADHLASQNQKFDANIASARRIKQHRERCKRSGVNPFTTKASDLQTHAADTYENHTLPDLALITRHFTAFFANEKTKRNGQTVRSYTLQVDAWTDPVTVQHQISRPERAVYFNLQTGADIKYKANGHVRGARVWRDGKQVTGDPLMTANQRDFYLESVEKLEAAMKATYEDAVVFAGFCVATPDPAARLGRKTVCTQFAILAFASDESGHHGVGLLFADGKTLEFELHENDNEKSNAPQMVGSFCVEQTTVEQYENEVLAARIDEMRSLAS